MTSITGATRTVPFSAATGGPVTGVIAGETTVACGFVNREKPATLTLAATPVAVAGRAERDYLGDRCTGALAGPTGQTGTPAVTAIPVTADTAYQLAHGGTVAIRPDRAMDVRRPEQRRRSP